MMLHYLDSPYETRIDRRLPHDVRKGRESLQTSRPAIRLQGFRDERDSDLQLAHGMTLFDDENTPTGRTKIAYKLPSVENSFRVGDADRACACCPTRSTWKKNHYPLSQSRPIRHRPGKSQHRRLTSRLSDSDLNPRKPNSCNPRPPRCQRYSYFGNYHRRRPARPRVCLRNTPGDSCQHHSQPRRQVITGHVVDDTQQGVQRPVEGRYADTTIAVTVLSPWRPLLTPSLQVATTAAQPRPSNGSTRTRPRTPPPTPARIPIVAFEPNHGSPGPPISSCRSFESYCAHHRRIRHRQNHRPPNSYTTAARAPKVRSSILTAAALPDTL